METATADNESLRIMETSVIPRVMLGIRIVYALRGFATRGGRPSGG
jgi:hypothetical protein